MLVIGGWWGLFVCDVGWGVCLIAGLLFIVVWFVGGGFCFSV